MRITVALVEPMYEINVGHIARVMANFGFNKLLLVNPKFDLNEARKYASHGYHVLKDARTCCFEDLKKFDYLIGTTAVFNVSSTNVLRSTVSPRFMAEAVRRLSGSICIVFGRDTTGLRNEELEQLDIIVSIYTSSTYPTLNIGHAVAITLYELSRHRFEDSEKIANEEQRERLICYLTDLAEASGFPEYKMPILERAFSRLIGKGRPTSREATLIIGLLRRASKSVRNSHRFSKI